MRNMNQLRSIQWNSSVSNEHESDQFLEVSPIL